MDMMIRRLGGGGNLTPGTPLKAYYSKVLQHNSVNSNTAKRVSRGERSVREIQTQGDGCIEIQTQGDRSIEIRTQGDGCIEIQTQGEGEKQIQTDKENPREPSSGRLVHYSPRLSVWGRCHKLKKL